MIQQNESIYIEDGVIPNFYVEAKLNQFIFETTGKREYTNVEMVRIRVPGDKHTEVVEEVREDHKHRFKNVWKAFKDGTDLTAGTPMSAFADLDPATLAKLSYLNINTVELMAAVTDSNLGQIGANGRELRDRAIRYLGSAAEDKTTSVILEQNQKIQDLQAKLDAILANQSDKEEAATIEKRGPGRPKVTVVPPHMQENESK